MHRYNYIALGDSYTIGEAVPIHQSFPYQVVQAFRKKGLLFNAPEILAKTGWTTDELLFASRKYKFLPSYDFATLLIGVNNQYRNRDIIEFKMEFETLIQFALKLVQNKKNHLVVLTIPDYSVTPFAAEMDRQKIEKELEVLNSVIKAVCVQYKLKLVDITPGSRKAETDPKLLAADHLHPSGKEYSRWAKKVFQLLASNLKKQKAPAR